MLNRTIHSALRMAALTLAACLGLACAVQANDFKLNNLDLDFGWAKLKAPVVDVRGSALTESEFRKLLDPKDNEPVTARINKLSAQSLAAQELTLTVEVMGQTATYRYEAVSISGLGQGRIAAVNSAKGSGKYTDPKGGDTNVVWTGTSIEGLNISALNEALTSMRPAGTAPKFLNIVDKYSVVSSSQSQAEGIKVTSGLSETRGLALSPGTTSLQMRVSSLIGWVSSAIKAEATGAKVPEPDIAALADYISVFEDIRMGTSETRDIEFNASANAKIGLKEGFTFKIARAKLEDMGVTETTGMNLEGMTGVFGQTKFNLSQLSMTGFSGLNAINALKSDLASGLIGKDKAPANVEQMLRYIPKLGSIKMAGLIIETPDTKTKQAAKEFSPLTTFGMRLFEITVRAQENGIPSDMRIALEGLKAPVPKDDPNTALLIQMGYSIVDTSARIDLAWSRERSEITVKEIGLDGVDMSKLKIAGVIGGASKDLFSGDMALAQVAAFGATIKSLDIKLENLGLVDRYLAMEAKKAKKEPEALKREWGTMATLIMPALIGDSDAAKIITNAVARFIASPKSLTINAKSKNAGGVGLADVIAAGDPKAVLGKIDVKATAE